MDENENIICVQGKDILSKYRPYETQIELPENIADGSYLVKLEGYMNYETDNSIKHSISIPIKVDRERSYVKGCTLDGNTLTVDIYDNGGLATVILTDLITGEEYIKKYDSYIEDDKIVYTFKENETPDLSNIMLEMADVAMNTSSYLLGGFSGELGTYITEISYGEKSYSIKLNFMGDKKHTDASLVLGFYDSKGSLIHTNIMENQTVASGEYEFTGNFDISKADICKLFILNNMGAMMPLDDVKIFDMKTHGIK